LALRIRNALNEDQLRKLRNIRARTVLEQRQLRNADRRNN
jgi:hypothetical protein